MSRKLTLLPHNRLLILQGNYLFHNNADRIDPFPVFQFFLLADGLNKLDIDRFSARSVVAISELHGERKFFNLFNISAIL